MGNFEKNDVGKKEINYKNQIRNYFGEHFANLLRLESRDLQGVQLMKAMELVKMFVFEHQHRDGITTSQLRNIYELAKKIEAGNYSGLTKLKYKLAYINGRSKNAYQVVKYTLLIEMLADETILGGKKEHFASFHTVMESLVAYHRYFNPKEKN